MDIWDAFLPVGKHITSDEPGLDPRWAAAMGVDPDALLVLRRVRDDVLPLIRRLERVGRPTLDHFWFLVHDRSSGVPCPPEDSGVYVHLRLAFSGKANDKVLPPWAYVRRINLSPEESASDRRIHQQCKWYLDLVEGEARRPLAEVVQVIGQQMHYFANMAQMMVR